MNKNILITDTGLYVNHRLQCLKKYKNRICIVKLHPDTTDISPKSKVVNVSFDRAYTDLLKKDYESWQYQCITKHAKEIVEFLTEWTFEEPWCQDVVILGDISVDALYILDVLQKSEYLADIHLILPLPFERTMKGTVQHDILSNLSKLRTLAIYDPYKLAYEKYGDSETRHVEQIINNQTAYLLERLDDLSDKMFYQAGNTKYFFDYERNSYVDTDFLYVLDDYEITHTLGLMMDPYYLDMRKEENDYLIESWQKLVPRPNGKQICEMLRQIRKEFAKINGISFNFEECTYNGPCAGACKVCDNEARELQIIAQKIDNVKYPEVRVEESL